VIGRANELEAIQLNTLQVLAEVRRKLAEMAPDKWINTKEDIEEQLRDLLQPGFQRDTPGDWLAQYPRYLKALRARVERLSGQYAKDQKHTALLQELSEPLQQTRGQSDGLLLRCPAAMQYRWMLEELRVSLFAQNLGTRQAVSQKRLQEQWQQVRAWLDKKPH
jgi:ATP-dependent helicase HrpA